MSSFVETKYTDNGKTKVGVFYLDKSGAMLTGWQQLKWSKGTDWFYFNSSGAMQIGWQKLNWKNKSWVFTPSN